MSNLTVQEENRILANQFLERNYYQTLRHQPNSTIEFFLTGRCNQKCEYCYIHKYSKEIYPERAHNRKTILENLQKLLNWYIKNKFIANINIFSAEFLVDYDFGDKVFSIIYNTLKKAGLHNIVITIPSNMSWIDDFKILNNVLRYNDLFEQIGIRLFFSVSIDGKFCDDLRKEHPDYFYEKLFSLAKKYAWGFHPEISSLDTHKWIENYKWWEEMLGADVKRVYFSLVRNEEWTEEGIKSLLEFLKFLIDKEFSLDREHTFEEKVNMFKYIFLPKVVSPETINISSWYQEKEGTYVGCSFSNFLHIRVGDLGLPLCHRLAYDDMMLGYWELDENGEIADFNPENIELLITKRYLKTNCLPYCEQCKFQPFCNYFCYGNAYENMGDFLMPVKENCDCQKARIIYIFTFCYNYGLLEPDIINAALDNDPRRISTFNKLKNLVFDNSIEEDTGEK